MHKIVDFMQLEILEVITIGLPFCVFKFLLGFYSMALGTPLSLSIGAMLASLGVLDLMINIINFFSLLFWKKRVLSACLLSLCTSNLATRFDRPLNLMNDLGNALDLFLSFIIVATVIGAGFLQDMSPFALFTWNLAVILNVLGAGMGRLGAVLRSFSTYYQKG